MKVAVESLIDHHVFPLTHRVTLREDWGESVHSSVDEQGSRGASLVLSAVKGLTCIQPVNFCQKGKRI